MIDKSPIDEHAARLAIRHCRSKTETCPAAIRPSRSQVILLLHDSPSRARLGSTTRRGARRFWTQTFPATCFVRRLNQEVVRLTLRPINLLAIHPVQRQHCRAGPVAVADQLLIRFIFFPDRWGSKSVAVDSGVEDGFQIRFVIRVHCPVIVRGLA